MSLAKIPLIVAFSLAFRRCITSPNPAPPKTERFSKKTLNTAWYTQELPKYATVSKYNPNVRSPKQ